MSAGIQRSPFETALGLTIHDVKNSLAMVLDKVEILQAEGKEKGNKVPDFRYEIKRINNNLVRLLSLYKLGLAGYKVQTDYNNIGELLEDLAIEYASLLEEKGVKLEFDCQMDLWGWFDRGLIYGVVDNAINNAIRYTKSVIRVEAKKADGCLLICVTDDGEGFTKEMLKQCAADDDVGPVSSEGGSTGLGFYFSRIVAKLHQRGGCEGRVELTNDKELGGGCFAMHLPAEGKS